MKLISWNVNGLRAITQRGDLAKFIEAYQPDILLLQEIKMNQPFEGFDDYRKFDSYASRKGYSGTSIWLKQSIKLLSLRAGRSIPSITPGAELSDFALAKSEPNAFRKLPAAGSEKECIRAGVIGGVDGLVHANTDLTDIYGNLLDEGRITAVKLGAVNFVSVYVPNSKEDLSRLAIRQRWDAWFRHYLASLDGPVVVGGDFNVAATELDLARPKENQSKHGFTPEERAGFAALLENYHDVWRERNPESRQYSWWSHYAHARANNVGWRIDYLLARGVKLTHPAILDQVRGSDHAPVVAEISEAPELA